MFSFILHESSGIVKEGKACFFEALPVQLTAQENTEGENNGSMKTSIPEKRIQAEDQKIKTAVPIIIEWYRGNKRVLPWREDVTAYRVWISEIMLQQTRIETVIPYYRRFLQEIPDIAALSATDEEKLLKLWEGLGYYSRARNLKKAAALVMDTYGGSLPQTAEELKKLPGIGEYTAGAIASIACGEAVPAVDGNVMRVITRLLACPEDIADAKTKKYIAALLQKHYPEGEKAALLTEGLMELGEILCLPNAAPKCAACPLHLQCTAHQTGQETAFPVQIGKKERRCEQKTVFLFQCHGKTVVRKRPDKGLLAGLWEFPNCEGWCDEASAIRQAEAWGACPEDVEECGAAKHIFTHVEWEMRGFRLLCREETGDFTWATTEEMKNTYSIPTAFRKFQKLL